MDDEVAVVDQDPFCGAVALAADGQFAGFLQLLSHFIGDRLRLARIGCGADYEIIGEGGYFPEVQYANVQGFSRFGCVRGYQPVR
jgi:hypothetical protein